MKRDRIAACGRCADLVHPVLSEAPNGQALDDARLTDRQRIAVLLQGASLLSLLERAGLGLAQGWHEAGVAGGRLCLPLQAISPRRSRLSQDLLRELLLRLFGAAAEAPLCEADPAKPAGLATAGGAAVAGRGEARRAARALLGQWWQPLVPVTADQAVAQILAMAPFLWDRTFAAARQALAGEILEVGCGATRWVAGAGARRSRLLAACGSVAELAARLGGPDARRWWEGMAPPATPTTPAAPPGIAAEVTSHARRRRAGDGATAPLHPPSEAWRIRDSVALAVLGRFEAALAALGSSRAPAARLQRARCQVQLGRLGAARLSLRRLETQRLPAEVAIEAAETALRVFANCGEPERLPRWVARALAAGRALSGLSTAVATWRARSHLVAALAAWDRQEPDAMDEHLESAHAALSSCSADVAAVPQGWWRYHHARGLRSMAAANGREVVEHLSQALRSGRRCLARHEAAGLWNDLGIGRVQQGELSGAERAFLHAQRLFSGCDGPRRATLALHNLAEVRLRRGRIVGVLEILARSTAENRRDGNLRGLTQDAELLARYHLVAGRPAEAIAACREALERLDRRKLTWRRDVLAMLLARALGWEQRPAEAAAAMAGSTPTALAELEPEERPALWAAAAQADRARRAAHELDCPAATLWRAILAGDQPPEAAWDVLGAMEPYRAARLVFDLERAAQGAPSVPVPWLRAASLTLRQLGAGAMADWLAERAAGPWEALAHYASLPAGDPRAAEALLRRAGGPGTLLVWRPTADFRTPGPLELAGAPGVAVTADLPGGRLELRCGRLDPPLAACFALAVRDLRLADTMAPGANRSALPAVEPANLRPPHQGTPAITSGPHYDVAEVASRSPARAGAAEAASAILGSSPAMRKALERLTRIAAADIPVLVRGESGTGKELVARQIHRLSQRASAPFLAVNCAAFAESLLLSDLFGHVRGAFTGADRERAGVFETARGGIVLLDEIGDLPLAAQGLLLRVLQEGEVRRLGESLPRRVDVRVLAATHRSLEQAVTSGAFREDLYYRLKVGAIDLPPLRDRGNDLMELADGVLRRQPYRPVRRLSAAALQRLRRHGWPGNVRELENVLRLAAALATDGVIQPDHLDLPPDAAPGAPYHRQVEDLRRSLVAEAITSCGGRHAEAARRLGISRQALSYLVGQLGLRS